jgi:SAM-dependent MidA family methyltransferase
MNFSVNLFFRRTALCGSFALFGLGLEARAADADWPTWRGPERTNRSPDEGLKKSWPDGGPELLWTFDNGGKGYSAPVIVGDRIYFTGSRDGNLLIVRASPERQTLMELIHPANMGQRFQVLWGIKRRSDNPVER